MLQTYGLPAVEVENPDGEIVLYLFREVERGEGELRAWVLTRPDGVQRRVAERWPGFFRCSCPDYWFRRRFDLDPCCKHCAGVRKHLETSRA